MSGNSKKWVAIAGGVLVVVAGALLKTMGDNHAVHTACEIALTVLGGLGFAAPVSILAPADKADKS